MGDGYTDGRFGRLRDLCEFLEGAEQPVLLVEGTRSVPEADMPQLSQMGALLAKRLPRVTFRTGNAQGSDTAFAEGVASVDPSRIQFVLPTTGMGKARIPVESPRFALADASAQAQNLLGEYSIKATDTRDTLRMVQAVKGELQNSRLAAKGRYIMRDALKVVGDADMGLAPATAGMFYVKAGDPMGGGTGHTIRVCMQHGAPVVFQGTWMKWLGQRI